MRTSRRIDEKRNASTMYYDAERRLRRKLLTMAEYNEIIEDIPRLYNFDTMETINARIADFFRLFGVHIVEHGIGWKLTWY